MLLVFKWKEEANRGFQPEIKPLSVNVEDYDIIAVGTPI